MTIRIGRPPGISSGIVIDGGGLGVLAELIPTTGEHGGSILANEAANVANAGKELRAVVTSPPSGSDLVSYMVHSNGSVELELTAGDDATYTIGYTAYADGVSIGTATTTVQVGAGSDPPSFSGLPSLRPLGAGRALSLPFGPLR